MSNPTDTELTYEQADRRLEEIVQQLDGGEVGLRDTLEMLREGRDLIEFCARELDAVSGEIEELRLNELLARLKGDKKP